MKKRIAYLVGSGISVDAGLPNVERITDPILRKETPHFKSVPKTETEIEVCLFLKELRCMWFKYSLAQKEPDYEDLYYLAYQIETSIMETEFYNPMIIPFCNELRKAFPSPFRGNPLKIEEADRTHVQCLAEWAQERIEKTLYNELNPTPKETKYLSKLFSESILNESRIDVFSLNHDSVLEQFLGPDRFCDGFTVRDMTKRSNYRGWDPNSFNNNPKLCLYKIHGSIDWQRDKRKGKSRWCKNGPNHSVRGVPMNEHMILCGSYNKMFGYHFGIFAELWARFYLKLMEHDSLIVAGYGFGDRAVNNALVHWCEIPNKKIMIIDPKAVELIDNIPMPYLKELFNEWSLNGRLAMKNCTICQLDSKDVESFVSICV